MSAVHLKSVSIVRVFVSSALFILSAIPTSAWGTCALGDCRYQNSYGLCYSCTGGPAHCKEAGYCDSCGWDCIVASPGGSEASRLPATEAAERDAPDYAYVAEIMIPANCQDTDASNGENIPATLKVWNPTEFLDQIQPYGLSITNELLQELAEADANAAYVVANRMYRGSGLMPTHDMHEGQYVKTTRITEITGIEEALGDSTKMNVEFIELPEGVQEYVNHHDDFEGDGNPTITVVSYLIVPGLASMQDYRRTTITLSSAPVSEEVVAASDNYWAPVYRVKDFRVETR